MRLRRKRVKFAEVATKKLSAVFHRATRTSASYRSHKENRERKSSRKHTSRANEQTSSEKFCPRGRQHGENYFAGCVVGKVINAFIEKEKGRE